MKKLDLKTIVIIILSLVLLFSLFRCKQNVDTVSKLELENQMLDSTVNNKNQKILLQEAITVNDKQALKDLSDSIFNLTKKQEKKIKDVIAYYSSISKTVIKDKLVPYIDTASRKIWEDSIKNKCAEVIAHYENNYIEIPKKAIVIDSNYTANLTVKRNGVQIDSLSIPDSQYIRFVTLKGGLLKKDASGKRHLFTKRSIQVQVLHTNPLINVTGQNSAIYISPKKARWLEKAILIGGGIFLGTKL